MTPLVEKYKPTQLADFAGIGDIRAMFERFAAAPYASAWLLVGSAGTGKTTIAYALAAAINGEVHHIASRSCDLETVERTCEFCHYYPMGGDWHVVIVDEADQMTRPAQVAWLSKLDGTEAPPNTIFVFTCNATKGLEPRFLSRTRVIEFGLAGSVPEAVAFLATVWGAETSAPVPDLEALFVACDCNVRDALMRLEVKLSLLPPVCAPASAVVQKTPKTQYVRRFDNRWIEVPA